MKNTITALVLALAGLGTLAAVLVARNDTTAASLTLNSDDPVVASFTRDLNRKPGPAAPAQRSMIDEDKLYQLANSPHWTGDPQNSEAGNEERSDANKKSED